MRINNNAYQKHTNISLVARMLWKTGGISRVDIARELNLYRSTVTNIIATLIESKLVYEGEEGSAMSRGGRKPIILRLNERFGCVVGIDVQPSHYRAVIVDISGTTVHEEKGSFAGERFEDIIDAILHSVHTQIERLALPLLGICIGVPGIVNSADGIIRYAEPFRLSNYDVYTATKSRHAVPVMVENDANCCAWLQLAQHRQEQQKDFICLIGDYHEGNLQFGDRSGIGVGIGVSIDGKVYSGSSWAAGEFLSLSWREGCMGQTGLPLDLRLGLASNAEAYRVFLKDLFSSLVPVVSVLDPSSFYIHGKPFASEEKVRFLLSQEVPQFEAALAKIGCRLILDAGDEYVVARGAAMMFLQKLFSIPELAHLEQRTSVGWDEVIALGQSCAPRML